MENKVMISDKMKVSGERGDYTLCPDFTGKILNIEITSSCNQDCIYCYFAAKGLHKKRTMIDEQFFYRITKEAYEMGITDVGLYMTAEPLMNPKVYDYVAYLKQLGFPYVYISTNGILCTPQNLEKLALAGVDSIKFSISAGTRENFLKHHGVDAFEKVKQNVEYAYRYREENELDYRLFMFSIVTNYNYDERQQIEDIFSPYVDELVFVDCLDGPIKLKGLQERLLKNKHAQYEANAARTIPCAMLFNRIVIDEEAYLCICCDSGDSFTRVINIKDMSLKEAVYSKEMQRVRKMHLENKVDNTICNRCAYGKMELIKPFENLDGDEYIEIESIDREQEILKRFG